MEYPNCQHQNQEDAIFCNGCGYKLEIECKECKKLNPPGSKFCNQCGGDISMPSAIPIAHEDDPVRAVKAMEI